MYVQPFYPNEFYIDQCHILHWPVPHFIGDIDPILLKPEKKIYMQPILKNELTKSYM